jgi:hypothetical protein
MAEPLSHDDFGIEDGNKLRLLRRGVVAVLFMAKGEQGSMQLVAILKTLQVPGLATCYLDITTGKNRDVIKLSRKTTAKITTLPYLALFCDGKLKFRYKGEVDRERLRSYCQKKVIDLSSASHSQLKPRGTPANSQQFSMARSNKSENNPGGGPHPSKAGIIGYNTAWRVDKG